MSVVAVRVGDDDAPAGRAGRRPGGGGWTSGTAPVPIDASGVPTGADHVAPPSVELTNMSWFAGVDAVFVYAM